eukprot:7391432-Prymnesium_polylepis.1
MLEGPIRLEGPDSLARSFDDSLGVGAPWVTRSHERDVERCDPANATAHRHIPTAGSCGGRRVRTHGAQGPARTTHATSKPKRRRAGITAHTVHMKVKERVARLASMRGGHMAAHAAAKSLPYLHVQPGCAAVCRPFRWDRARREARGGPLVCDGAQLAAPPTRRRQLGLAASSICVNGSFDPGDGKK